MVIDTRVGSIERAYDASTHTGRVVVRVDMAALAVAGFASLLATHVLRRFHAR
jgi:hypothetical protein